MKPIAFLMTLAALATTTMAALAQTPVPIEQISANTQPGWGKVYASANPTGWYVALISNGDLAPGAPGNSDKSWEVFRWAADGSVRQLTQSTAERPPPVRIGTSAPSISDDGRRVAFSSIQDLTPGAPGNADGSREVFLWDEAAGLRQLTDTRSAPDPDAVGSHHPWLSGDGHSIVFASDMHGRLPGAGLYADAQTDIYLWQEAAGIRRLTTIASPQRRAWMPRLAGDGRTIVFYANGDLDPAAPGNGDGSPEVFLWSEGTGFRQLTNHVGGKAMGIWSAPAVSRDGSAVVFDADADLTPSAPGNLDGSTEIFTWTAFGGLRQLTNLPQSTSARSPTISADGQTIAFVSTGDLTPGAPGNPDGGLELFLHAADGSVRQLTRGASAGGIALPVLSGAAELVTFLSDRDLAVGNQVLTPQTFLIRLGVPHPPATPPTGPTGQACPQIANRVPGVAQSAALANPSLAYGFGQPANPSLPAGPANPPRVWLTLLDIGKPFSPANPLLWRSGCP